MLSLGIILLGRLAKPFHGLHLIFRHAVAVVVAAAQAALGGGVILFGSLANPLQGLRQILLNAATLEVAEGQTCIEQ